METQEQRIEILRQLTLLAQQQEPGTLVSSLAMLGNRFQTQGNDQMNTVAPWVCWFVKQQLGVDPEGLTAVKAKAATKGDSVVNAGDPYPSTIPAIVAIDATKARLLKPALVRYLNRAYQYMNGDEWEKALYRAMTPFPR